MRVEGIMQEERWPVRDIRTTECDLAGGLTATSRQLALISRHAHISRSAMSSWYHLVGHGNITAMSQNCAVMLSRNRARRDEGALHVSTLSGSRPGALAIDGSAKQAEPAAYLEPSR